MRLRLAAATLVERHSWEYGVRSVLNCSDQWSVVSDQLGPPGRWLAAGQWPLATDNWCWGRGGGICDIGVMLGSRRVMGWRGVIGAITHTLAPRRDWFWTGALRGRSPCTREGRRPDRPKRA